MSKTYLVNQNQIIPRQSRLNILLLSDNIKLPTGIASMSLQIIRGTIHRFNWFQVGCILNYDNYQRVEDFSQMFNDQVGLTDSLCLVYPFNGYGNQDIIKYMLQTHKIDAILHFTDPRQWTWLYNIQNKIRRKVPIMYYNIWDNLPYPRFNQPYYQSCDLLMNISKQTNNIVRQVRRLVPVTQDNCVYVPHGINPHIFTPLPKDDPDMLKVREAVLGNKQYDIIFYSSNKNMRRKNISDILVQYQMFANSLPIQKRQKVCLILKTQLISPAGTNFYQVHNRLIQKGLNVIFIDRVISQQQLNMLYNLADVSINISSAQGFGLNFAQSVMAGTPVISIVTGGLQDQMRFENENGGWINFDLQHPSNLDGRYTKCGQWAFPIFPFLTLAGSVEVPYIYDNYIPDGALASKMLQVYNNYLPQLQYRGQKGRQFMMGQGQMSCYHMGRDIATHIQNCVASFTPKKKFQLINVVDSIKKINGNSKGVYNRLNNTWE